MPELPEVETVVRTLRENTPSLLDRTIQWVEILWPREVHGIDAAQFTEHVTASRVSAVRRHGKNIMIDLSKRGYRGTMFVHLKMSGRLNVVAERDAHTKHARVIWHLDQHLALRFDDARKFGRVWLPILLDQRFIAGIGNIYADESLHRAKLHPQRIAATLTSTDAERLFSIVQTVLQEGIQANGASFDWVYPDGNFQENFRVYGQTGKPCNECGTEIVRILVGQRSTHYCPQCQI